MEGIIRLILLFFFLCGCQNGKITQIYQYQSYIDIDVKTESSYCFPNSIVMVGEENDSSTWYWNGDGPAEGFELIQILSVVKDSLNIHIERTYFNGNPEAFAVQTEILADTTFLGKMGNFKSLYVDLLKFQGDRGIEINTLPKYGEKSDTRRLFFMDKDKCKCVKTVKQPGGSNEYYQSAAYRNVITFFNRFEKIIGAGI